MILFAENIGQPADLLSAVVNVHFPPHLPVTTIGIFKGLDKYVGQELPK